MSATNTTTNYNLPIFIETDKPAWLVDFNGAMRSIDTQMKTNADAIATKSPILTFNDTADIDFTKSGDIITANLASAVSDKVGRALVTPIAAPTSDQIVAIDTNGAQENLSLGTGLEVTNNILSAIDLNLSDITTYAPGDMTSLTSGVTVSGGSITVALNSDKTIGKIYGNIILNSTLSSNSSSTIQLPATVNVDDGFNIFPAGIGWRSSLQTGIGLLSGTISISNTGQIRLVQSCYANTTTIFVYIPSIYFFTNFGDTPTT